jgi:hypothetical protein
MFVSEMREHFMPVHFNAFSHDQTSSAKRAKKEVAHKSVIVQQAHAALTTKASPNAPSILSRKRRQLSQTFVGEGQKEAKKKAGPLTSIFQKSETAKSLVKYFQKHCLEQVNATKHRKSSRRAFKRAMSVNRLTRLSSVK